MLARLFYHNLSIVVVDEGTSALDPELEKNYLSLSIELKKQGSTIICVSHRTLLNNTLTILFHYKI